MLVTAMGPGSAEQREERCTASGTRARAICHCEEQSVGATK